MCKMEPMNSRSLVDPPEEYQTLFAIPDYPPDFVKLFHSDNRYQALHWDFEKAARYIFGFGHDVLEASFFRHFRGSLPVKQVLELPTSYGCPIGCRHCASALLTGKKQLSISQLGSMTRYILEDQQVPPQERLLITFSG